MSALEKSDAQDPQPPEPKTPQALDSDALPELTETAIATTDSPADAQSDTATPDRRPALESIYDVPVKVSVVLGKTKMDVASLMKLGDGDIIELDRTVGEPIDLYVNDRLIARGELVMVDGALGVTMTEIVKDNEL